MIMHDPLAFIIAQRVMELQFDWPEVPEPETEQKPEPAKKSTLSRLFASFHEIFYGSSTSKKLSDYQTSLKNDTRY
jgi:hypothetical protein